MGVQKPGLESGRYLESGQTFPETGYYSYAGHADSDGSGCFVSSSSTGGMLFTKGEPVPGLVSCRHKIRWKLDARY